ncbi:hypothetical protein SprV_0501892900 [Sparganum proliferum]
MLIPSLTPSPFAPTTTTLSVAGTDTTNFSCPHFPRTFASRIGPVGHLRIHRTETGEPVPEATAFTRSIRLHCPHCPRTFMRRIGLFGHMRIHESLWYTTAGYTTPSHHPSPASHRTSTSPTASTQLPPPTQVGSMRLDSVLMRLLSHE